MIWIISTAAKTRSPTRGRRWNRGGRDRAHLRLLGRAPPAGPAPRLARSLSSVVAMAIDVGQSRRCGRLPHLRRALPLSARTRRGDRPLRSGGYEGEVEKCTLSYRAVSGFEARDNGRRRIRAGRSGSALHNRASPRRCASICRSRPAAQRALTSFNRAIVNIAETAQASRAAVELLAAGKAAAR